MQINSNYILIDNKKSFELSLVSLMNSKVIAVDTESSGFYTYFSRVCLVQITANGKNYIFDPLSNVNISKLGDVFSSPKILKIFHSAWDDIKALKRDFQFEFQNIADTMYSSKLLGMEHNSLEYLVEHYHNVKLSKTQQKSNWEIRPLKEMQLKYAALDTAYLESIWEKMRAELDKSRLLEEAVSEFEKMAAEPYSKKDEVSEVALHKFPDINNYSPVQRRLIVDILNYREEKAKKTDKAPFRILNKEAIESIVKENPDLAKLVSLYGKKDGEAIYDIIVHPKGEPIETILFPKANEELNPEEDALYNKLKKWREKVIRQRNVDHSMLLSNKNLVAIIKTMPANLDDLRKLNLMSEWKLQNYGPSILRAMRNENYDDLLKAMVVIRRQKKRRNNNNNKNIVVATKAEKNTTDDNSSQTE